MIETLLGGAIGGVLRIAPEVLKWLDRRGDRAHELALFDRQIESDRNKQSGQTAAIEAQSALVLDAGGMSALVESIRGQSTRTGIRWVDALNTSVRPVVTYWLLLLYAAAKTVAVWMLVQSGASNFSVLEAVYTPDDQAMLSGILSFWFVGRVWDKKK